MMASEFSRSHSVPGGNRVEGLAYFAALSCFLEPASERERQR